LAWALAAELERHGWAGPGLHRGACLGG
jgi:hypothetical protein